MRNVMPTVIAPLVYVLIQTEAGHAIEAAASLRAVVGEGAVEVVQGPFDIIVRVNDEEREAQVLRRCERSPFIRALPCRTRRTITERSTS